MPRILVVNVNTTSTMTDAIAAQARSVAAPGTEIVGLTPSIGAESVEGNFESYLAAVGVMDAVQSYQGLKFHEIRDGHGRSRARSVRRR